MSLLASDAIINFPFVETKLLRKEAAEVNSREALPNANLQEFKRSLA